MRIPTRIGLAAIVPWTLLGLLAVTAAGADVPRTDVHGDPLPDGALARLGTIRWRAGSTVTRTAFLPDGKSVLTLSKDCVAQVWDRDTGKELRHFDAAGPASTNPHAAYYLSLNDNLNGAAVTADGRTVACGSRDGIVRVWDVATGKEVGKAGEGHLDVLTQLALTADGKTLALVTYGRKITLWNVADGKKLRSLGDSADGTDMVRLAPYKTAFSPDGKTLVQVFLDLGCAGGVKTSAIVWDAVGGKELRRVIDRTFTGTGSEHLAAVSPDAKLLALPAAKKVKLIDLTTGKEKLQLEGHDGRAALVFSPDGKRLVGLTGHNEALVIWDVATGKTVRQFGKAEVPGDGRDTRSVLDVSSDGKLLAWGDGPVLRLVDLETGKETNGTGHASALRDVSFARDGKTVLTSGNDTVRRWDAATGKEAGQVAVPGTHVFVLPSPDERVLAAGDADGTIRLLDATTGREKHALKGAQQVYGISAAFSPDSRLLAAISPVAQVVDLYDVATGQVKHALPLPAAQVAPGAALVVRARGPRRVFFSPDSRLVAATDGNVIIWDAASGREERQIGLSAGGMLRDALFSPDGRTVTVETTGGEVGVWEVASGQKRLTISTHAMANSTQRYVSSNVAVSSYGTGTAVLAFSPDGRLLAQANDRTARLWDLRTGKEVGKFEGHRGPVLALAFAPDGKRLVTASADTTALLWDAVPVVKKLPVLSAALPKERLETLWTDLGQNDGVKAYDALRALAGDPVQAVPFLAARVKPAIAPDAAHLTRLIGGLDNEDFSVRESARKELEKLGELALPALRAALKGDPSAEQRRALDELVSGATTVSPSGERLRLLRALEVLELAGTPEAVKALKGLAAGAPDALPTTQARAVLERQGQK